MKQSKMKPMCSCGSFPINEPENLFFLFSVFQNPARDSFIIFPRLLIPRY
jgi:hypothetical protein